MYIVCRWWYDGTTSDDEEGLTMFTTRMTRARCGCELEVELYARVASDNVVELEVESVSIDYPCDQHREN